jgi:hypothetical protein
MPTQNSFVTVRGENEARSYPIAPGNSITFKDETAPYIYTKTMGFSQLDRPVFEKYRLTKEESPIIEPKQDEPINLPLDDIKAEISEIRALYDELREKIDKPKRPTKKEVVEDE